MSATFAPATVVSRVKFRAEGSESRVRSVIEQLTESSPFRLHHLVADHGSHWSAEIVLRDPSMEVLFPKTVELHLQLSRKFSIVSFVYGTDITK